MPFFDGAAGKVYFKAWRAPVPRAATVVHLHGFGEHSGIYHRLGNTLNAAGIDLWALDEIGHGLSDGPRASIDSIDDLVTNGRILTELAARDGGPVFLSGHSLGGAAAAVLASRDASGYRGVVLSGAAISQLDWMVAEGEDKDTLSFDGAGDLSSDPFYLDELENDPLAFTEAEGTNTLHRILPPAWEELGQNLGRVELPVLFVHGELDLVVPVEIPRTWAARLPSATLAEFPGAKHDILNETVHREAAQAIIDFVKANI